MYTDLQGKTAFIMGAANPRGLGFGIASALLEAGASVCLGDKDGKVTDAAASLGGRFGREVFAVSGDLRSSKAVDAMAKELAGHCSRLDILVQCAGRMPLQGTTADTDPVDWADTVGLNLTGTYHLLRAVLPLMREKGSIIAMASGAGVRPLQEFSAYSASKAGLVMLLRTVAMEYAASGIRANVICPGPVESEMLDKRVKSEAAASGVSEDQRREAISKGIPLGRVATVGDVTALALFLASDVSGHITGQALNLSGGMIAS